jgi:phosphotransferase system enzyme I (PtsP)
VGDELGISQFGEVPLAQLAGIVSTRGSALSHTAVLAAALGVPAVMGVADLPLERLEGREVVVDGYQGRIYIQPSPVVLAEYRRLAREEEELLDGLRELRDLPAETRDGKRVSLRVNAGLMAELGPGLDSGAEGVGLYRTEFPFLVRESFPGENEQYDIYQEVLRSWSPRPVTLRTLDVGGDKSLPYFSLNEDNPFLGSRGIRLTLDHPEIFLTQLRAMLRANAALGNLRILLPFITTVSELDEALGLLRRAHEELNDEGQPCAMAPVGAMIEVPAAVYVASALAQRVDFLAIGTNDLTQYMLAVDRNNARVATLYDNLHPAVIRASRSAVEEGHGQGKSVTICGEMAGDPAAALLLLGMGIDQLSMAASSIPRVKSVIRTFSYDRARELLGQALTLDDPRPIRKLVNAAIDEAGLGGLVRPGK